MAQVCGALPDVWQWPVMPGKRASHLASRIQQSRGLIYNPQQSPTSLAMRSNKPFFLFVMLG
jgi:hypothetical protein